jgi:hypothetical protein
MKVSNPRGVTESKSRDQATLVSLRPAARFRIVSCGCVPKVGFFEYSDALPRAETAEATGPFRDQGLALMDLGGWLRSLGRVHSALCCGNADCQKLSFQPWR